MKLRLVILIAESERGTACNTPDRATLTGHCKAILYRFFEPIRRPFLRHRLLNGVLYDALQEVLGRGSFGFGQFADLGGQLCRKH